MTTGEVYHVHMMRDDYLTEENPLKAILFFSLPMMAGNLFQQFYTMADSIIVGRFIGENALASVGASYALTAVFISIAIGGGAGASVITSKAFGAKDYEKVKESISTSLIAFLVISFILAVFGYLFSDRIMLVLNTPQDILSDAVLYLRIYFLGLPFYFSIIYSHQFSILWGNPVYRCFCLYSLLF